MGTDYHDTSHPCMCGKGQIVVTQSSPDHPWVRANQVSYSATIECEACQLEYEVQSGYRAYPHLVLRAEKAAHLAAIENRKNEEDRIAATPEAAELRKDIAAYVDKGTSMAAKHRALQHLRLTHETIAKYRKRPYSGAEAAAKATGRELARISRMLVLDGENRKKFQIIATNLEQLEAEEERTQPRSIEIEARSKS